MENTGIRRIPAGITNLGFWQDFLPRVRVDTKWVHKLLVTEWSVSHETKKKHIVTKGVVGLLLGVAVSTNKHPS